MSFFLCKAIYPFITFPGCHPRGVDRHIEAIQNVELHPRSGIRHSTDGAYARYETSRQSCSCSRLWDHRMAGLWSAATGKERRARWTRRCTETWTGYGVKACRYSGEFTFYRYHAFVLLHAPHDRGPFKCCHCNWSSRIYFMRFYQSNPSSI